MLVWHCPACITNRNQPDDMTKGPISVMGALSIQDISILHFLIPSIVLNIVQLVSQSLWQTSGSRSDIGHGSCPQETDDANGSALWQQLDAANRVICSDEKKGKIPNEAVLEQLHAMCWMRSYTGLVEAPWQWPFLALCVAEKLNQN